MRISSAFPSQYLKAADLGGRRIKVSISHVGMEDLGGDLKPILYFISKEKGLVLNKTNANAISQAYGDDTDAWSAQIIELYEATVEFQGRQVQAIRVHVPRQVVQVQAPVQRPVPPPPAAVAAAATNGNGNVHAPVGTIIDDDIPF
jgi:hypothetical protein